MEQQVCLDKCPRICLRYACYLSLQKHKDKVAAVSASKDGQTIASGSWDWKIIVWDIRTGASLRECRVCRFISLYKYMVQ